RIEHRALNARPELGCGRKTEDIEDNDCVQDPRHTVYDCRHGHPLLKPTQGVTRVARREQYQPASHLHSLLVELNISTVSRQVKPILSVRFVSSLIEIGDDQSRKS